MDRDEHRRLQELLPWYVTGRLDAAEQAQVVAHLDACAECQAEIKLERRLESEVARLPLDVERGWALMRKSLAADAAPASRGAAVGTLARSPWLGWSVAAALVVAVGVTWLPQTQPERYHALGAAPAAAQATGNIVVIFLPDTTERQMRETLKASQARLVDGPTTANGYLLHVEPARRAAALASLRAQKGVVVAEPLDGAAP